jgi:hypothetical protein
MIEKLRAKFGVCATSTYEAALEKLVTTLASENAKLTEQPRQTQQKQTK